MQVLRELGRHMFYMEPPENFKTKNIHEVPDYITHAVPFMFLMISVEFVVAWAMGVRKLYRINDTMMSLNLGTFMLLLSMLYQFLVIFSYSYVYQHFRLIDLPTDSVITWLGLFFGVDLAYYWFHRYAHEIHLIWAAHSVHHSGEDYNFATALRQGALQSVTSWIWYVPLCLVFHPAALHAHQRLNTLYQYWIHSSVIGPLGPLEYVLNTASHHRLHHRPPGNCNYGGVLIIWDRIFGTYVGEDKRADYYGLASQYSSFDPVWANFEHYKRIFSNIRNKDGTRPSIFNYLAIPFKRRVVHKWVCDLSLLFAPLRPKQSEPLWRLPQEAKRVKYDGLDSTAHHPALVAYVVFHFIVSQLSSIWLMIVRRRTEYSVIVFYVFLFSYSLICVGRLCDSFSSGKNVEFARLIIITVTLVLRLVGVIPETIPSPIPKQHTEAFIVGSLVIFWSSWIFMSSKLSKVRSVPLAGPHAVEGAKHE